MVIDCFNMAVNDVIKYISVWLKCSVKLESIKLNYKNH